MSTNKSTSQVPVADQQDRTAAAVAATRNSNAVDGQIDGTNDAPDAPVDDPTPGLSISERRSWMIHQQSVYNQHGMEAGAEQQHIDRMWAQSNLITRADGPGTAPPRPSSYAASCSRMAMYADELAVARRRAQETAVVSDTANAVAQTEEPRSTVQVPTAAARVVRPECSWKALAAAAGRPFTQAGPSSSSSPTTTASPAPISGHDRNQKGLVAEMSKLQLDNAIAAARRARQTNDSGEHVCGSDCPLRGAIGHGGVEPSH